MQTWGNYYWPYWLTLMSATFLVPEIIAALTNVYNTLSWYCWRELDISVSVKSGMDTIAWWTSLISWLLIAGTLTIHIWWKGI